MAITRLNSLAIPAGTVEPADISYPLTNFSSTGIDDNATSTAISINSIEQVQIGGDTDFPGFATHSLTVGSPAAGGSSGDAGYRARGTNRTGFDFIQDPGGQAWIYNRDNAEIRIGTNGTERMRIANVGNVGIGVSPSTAKLHVQTGATGTIAQFRGADTDLLNIDGDSNAITLDARNVGAFNIEIQGSNALTVDSSGNVGIGDTSPETPLHIKTTNKLGSTFTGSTRGEGITVEQTNYTSGNYISLIEAPYAENANPCARIGVEFTGNEGSSLVFGTSNSYATGITNMAMTIDHAGNVGIGEAPATANQSYISSAYTKLLVKGNSANKIGTVQIRSGDPTNYNSIEIAATQSQALSYVWSGTDTSMVFGTNNTERMRIHNDGEFELKTSSFFINHTAGGVYKNLGTVTGGSGGSYIHVKTNAVWGEGSMTMFRITGYYPYNNYSEGYLGAYLYGVASYRSTPYGPIYANQGNHAVAHSMYYSQGSGAELILVLEWNTTYNGVMIEHIGAGSNYGNLMRDDLEIVAYTHSTSTTGVY